MQVNNTAKVVVGLLASASLLVPTVAIANNRYQNQIVGQLMLAVIALGLSDDYQLLSEPYIDTLNTNGEKLLTLTLNKGSTYVIVGVCDEDCNDMDMEIYDKKGHSIAADRNSDSYPSFQITPTWTGQFWLEVDMSSCSASSCYYGIGIFRQ